MTGNELIVTSHEVDGVFYTADIQGILKIAFTHKIYSNKNTW